MTPMPVVPPPVVPPRFFFLRSARYITLPMKAPRLLRGSRYDDADIVRVVVVRRRRGPSVAATLEGPAEGECFDCCRRKNDDDDEEEGGGPSADEIPPTTCSVSFLSMSPTASPRESRSVSARIAVVVAVSTCMVSTVLVLLRREQWR